MSDESTPSIPSPPSPLSISDREIDWVKIALIGILVLSVVTALLTILQTITPGIRWFWLLLPAGLISLEGMLTTGWIKQPERRSVNKPLYRSIEVLLILLLARAVTWWLFGSWPSGEGWFGFLRNPLSIISDGAFWVVVFLFIISWERGATWLNYFEQMKLDQAELNYLSLPLSERKKRERPLRSMRGVIFEQFSMEWLIGGVGMALLAAMSTIDYAVFDTGDIRLRTIFDLSIPNQMVVALLLYFGVGFLLFSQGRLAIQNARWMHAGVYKTAGVDRSWRRSTLWILLAVGLLAAFLPIGETIFISRVLQFILVLILQIGTLITFLFFALISLLFPRWDIETESAPAPEPVQPPPIFAPPPPEAVAEPGFPIVGTLFWISFAVILVLALLFFLRERDIRLQIPGLTAVWQRIVGWWRSVWRTTGMYVADFRDAIVTRLVRDEDVGVDLARPWRFVRLNALTPRQKLRYFYLSTVRRAEERGEGRQDSDTPLEYADGLKTSWPRADENVDAVTAGFLKARYSRGTIDEADVSQVQTHWKELRAELKRRKDRDV